ncbi:FAD-dependent oxidoreductase [Haloplasma contractile]|uniref:NADH oxidase protein n=1 Tax=Haloplasma contractile SSD-17B TaxID=1033810 RepID=U2FPS4_9MOLU|nr:FAD-dependent oxidoreductase [Haloplasma contractile]ERJ13039.1 NADH oxidase protein [Haloplasma contractile SSD-17B]
MKVIVVGCTHAGTAAVINTARLHKDAQITVYERNDNVSFLSCGIALYVGGVIKDVEGLFYSSPKELERLGANIKMKHEVVSIDTTKKVVTIKNLKTEDEFQDEYDKLIVATGSWPIVPRFEGIEFENILLSKNFYQANTIIERAKHAKKTVVIGAGYIGVELAEAFCNNGKEVTLIDAQDRILSKYLDKEFTDVAEEAFRDHGVTLAIGEMVERFEGEGRKVRRVVTNKATYDADLVILCIGFRPNTELLKGQVDRMKDGAILVDEYMRTSKEDVFAVGDSCTLLYNPTGERRYIPLATNAVRTGTLAARNLVSPTTKHLGTQGTSGIKIFEHNIASTGLTVSQAKEDGIIAKSVTVVDHYRPEFMPTHEEATLKVVYEESSKRILGAQIRSETDLTQMVNTMSVVIQNKMTIDELAFIDFFFQPFFNKPWNLLNQAGLQANNKE